VHHTQSGSRHVDKISVRFVNIVVGHELLYRDRTVAATVLDLHKEHDYFMGCPEGLVAVGRQQDGFEVGVKNSIHLRSIAEYLLRQRSIYPDMSIAKLNAGARHRVWRNRRDAFKMKDPFHS